jgi:hypothetical protein
MNERIRELAEQAGIKITTLTDNGVEYDYEDVDMDGSEDLSKFAELIVRVCIAKCNDLESMKYIADHFGIKIQGLEK